jgi:hypothetical protein
MDLQQLSSRLRAPVLIREGSRSARGFRGRRRNHPEKTGGLRLLAPEKPLSIGRRQFAIDGAGIVDGRLVRNHAELRQALPAGAGRNMAMGDLASWWAEHATNPCALFVLDEKHQEALVLPDPLGGALTWHLPGVSGEAISSDNMTLVEVSKAWGQTVTPSVDFQLQRVVFGNGGYQVASHDEFSTIPALHYWHLDGEKTTKRRFASLDDRFNASYGDQLQLLRDELVRNVTALANASAELRIAHLTAGFDSRLVLGGLLAADVHREFKFFCSGPQGTLDRIGADGLTQVFNLQRIDTAGLRGAELPTHVQRVMAPLLHSGGLTSTGPTGLETPWKILAVGGGYGGILRTTKSAKTGDLDADTGSDVLFDHFALSGSNSSSFLLPAARTRLATQLFTSWRDSASQGTPSDAIGDRLYVDVRNRYHFGQSSLLWSRVGARFDPLYSVTALAISQSLPVKPRATNVVGMDLMEMLAPGLSSYPFDHDRFGKNLLKMRRRPRHAPFPEWQEPDVQQGKIPWAEAVPAHPVPSGFQGVEPAPEPSDAEKDRMVRQANRLGVHYWQLARLDEAQSALRGSLDQLDLESVEESIDLEYVRRLAVSEPSTRGEIRDIHSLLGSLLWLAGAGASPAHAVQ